MTAFVILPLLALCVAVFQETILLSLTFDTVRINVAFLLVVYGGFFLEEREGFLLALYLGVFLDGLLSNIPGVYVILYMSIFFFTRWMSGKMNRGKPWTLALFSFLVSFPEFLILYAAYGIFYGKDLSGEFLRIYLPQAAVAGIICPFVFPIFDRLAGMIHGERERSAYKI
jgi:rod shape-determining protein MreD